MFVKGLKAGEADFVEKDWHSGLVPTGEPGLISCFASSEQNLWEEQPLPPRCQHIKYKGRTCLCYSPKITRFSGLPSCPYFVPSNVGFIGGGSV